METVTDVLLLDLLTCFGLFISFYTVRQRTEIGIRNKFANTIQILWLLIKLMLL